MKKYKLAISGYDVVEVMAKSKQDAEEKFWEDGLNSLYNCEIEEIVPADKEFEFHTDLN